MRADEARRAAEPGIELDSNTVNIRDPELRKTLKKTCRVGHVRGPGMLVRQISRKRVDQRSYVSE